MKQHKLKYPVELMCKVLNTSKSGYYNWLSAGPSRLWLENQEIMEVIHSIFEDSYQSYGSPRMSVELEKRGFKVSRPCTARMMKASHLQARRRRKWKQTTDSNHGYPIAPNILNRQFTTTRPNEVWVSDITYIETSQGWLYLTVIIDLFDRKVIGWAMSEDMSENRQLLMLGIWQLETDQLSRNLCFILTEVLSMPAPSSGTS